MKIGEKGRAPYSLRRLMGVEHSGGYFPGICPRAKVGDEIVDKRDGATYRIEEMRTETCMGCERLYGADVIRIA